MADAKMEFDLHQATEVLQRTPAVLRAMLGGISRSWAHNNYGPETFSPFDVVGHLIHGDRTDWIPRARIILEHGEARPFEPFDRYAMYEQNRGKSMDELLDTFEQTRSAALTELAELNISDAQLALRGTHPELGTVTLGQLLATWVTHDLNHVHQIAKCLGYQYRNEVGPWRAHVTFTER